METALTSPQSRRGDAMRSPRPVVRTLRREVVDVERRRFQTRPFGYPESAGNGGVHETAWLVGVVLSVTLVAASGASAHPPAPGGGTPGTAKHFELVGHELLLDRG